MKITSTKIYISLILTMLCIGPELHSQDNNDFSYLGETPPSSEPFLFAPGKVSTVLDELNSAFSPDGQEYYFSLRRGYYFTIFCIKKDKKGNWGDVELAPFSGKYSDADPVFNQDGSRLYFCTTRQASQEDPTRDFNIAYVEKTENGWSDAKILPFCTSEDEYFVSFTADERKFYFHKKESGINSIYCIEKTDGKFGKAYALPSQINSGQSEWDPMISPDDSYMLFSSNRSGNYGRGDLYVSFRINDTNWSEALNLGININTPGMDYCPSFSPDGNYLFYSSYKYQPIYEPDMPYTSQEILDIYYGPENGYGDIYWVSTSIIDSLRKEALKTDAYDIQSDISLDRSKVILPVSINEKKLLNVILDTGMPWAGIYLFHSESMVELNLSGNTDVNVGGAGSGSASSAILVDSLDFSIGDIKLSNQIGVVSQSEHTQTFPTDGVMGWSVFSHPYVFIDYDNEKLHLLSDLPELDDTWYSIDINLNEHHLPFFTMEVSVNEEESVQTMLFYLDLAASENLEMLVREDSKFSPPENMEKTILGTGLSGDFEGGSGSVYYARLGKFEFKNTRATFPDGLTRTTQGDNTDGALGAEFMMNFNSIYDYNNKKIHIQPSKYFSGKLIAQ